MKLIILEGISGCGKSTLIHPVNALSNYRDLVIMRFTPSNWVYNALYHRPFESYEYLNGELQKTLDVHVAWLKVEASIAKERQQEKSHTPGKQVEVKEYLDRAAKLFDYYFNKVTVFLNVHQIQTELRSVEETVEEIREKVYGDQS